jgi:monooxygenase
LNLKAVGGIKFVVDNQPIQVSDSLFYKGVTQLLPLLSDGSVTGVMLSGLPNLSWTIGYTNASFTLKSDLTSQYVCRLIKHMDAHHFKACTPNPPTNVQVGDGILDTLTSGYIARSRDLWPKQGKAFPWQTNKNYLDDYWLLKYGSINDPVLSFK